MTENNDLNDLLTNIAAHVLLSITEKIVLQYLVERYLDILLRINKYKQITCNLHSYDIGPKISKNDKSKNGLPHNNSEKNYQRQSKPNSVNNVAHTKMCNRRQRVNKLTVTDKDILKHITNSFFSDQKVASIKTEPNEILLSKHNVVDTNYKLKTVELNDSSLITDAEKCVKSEPVPYTNLKQNEPKSADNDETQPLDLLVIKKQFSTRTPIYHVYNTEVKSHPQTVNGVPWNLLNAEKWRLVTFAQYPHTAQKSAILLANGGFAYFGSGRDSDDTVICYFCGGLKRGWVSSDDIQETHRNLSPDCSMVTGANCNNIPMTVPVNGETLFFQFYNPNNANGNTIKGLGYNQNNELETDCAGHNTPAATKNNLVTPAAQASRDVGSGHVSDFGSRPNQTDVRPDISSISMSQEPARPNTIHNQPANNGAPLGTVSSNSSTLTSSSSSVIPNRTPASSVQQGSINNISSTGTAAASSRPGAAVQSTASTDRQHVTVQTATSPPHVNQSTQNSASVVGATAPTAGATAPTVGTTAPTVGVTAPTVGVTAPTNQSANQPQGNSSESTTGSSQNTGQSNNKGPTYGELGIITERPKRFEYAVTATRFASFEHWPRDHPLKKEDLSAAGFYYAGYGDCARCFYCGGGLRNWEDDDNVWVEHARWFPKCAYIRQTIGQQFVDTVQDLNKSNDKITYEMVTDKLGSTAASFQLDTRNTPLKRDPAVLTVMEMGYSEKDVIEAANYVKDTYGMLSSDKVFEKLEMDGKSRGANGASATTSFDSKQKLPPAKEEKEMKKLKEENGQLRQQTVCKICMDKEVAVVFLPCGHFVSCTDCAAAMKDCPVCRKQVRGIVRAFMG